MKRRAFIREIVLCSAMPLLWLPRRAVGQPGWSPAALALLKPSAAAVAACTTMKVDSVTGGSGDSSTTANSSSFIYFANTFTTGGSGFTCCAASAWLDRFGSPAGTLTAQLWSDSAGSPGALIGSGSSTVDVSTVPTSQTETVFSDLSASLSASTSYWLVLLASFTPSGTDGYRWYRRDVTSTIKNSSNGSSWSTASSTRRSKFKLFST